MGHRIASFLFFVVAVGSCSEQASGQTTVQTAEFTIGVGQPVVNTSLPLYIFLSNPVHVPIPTGTVTVSFGDGQTETDTLTRGVAVTNHSYASTGAVTITAAYNGDTNFSPMTTTQSRVVLASAPAPVTLNTFGSSTTQGVGASSAATDYASLTAAAEGWTLANYGVSGNFVSNETPYEYALQVTSNTHSSLLIGTNEIAVVGPSAAGNAEYVAALTADYAYLLVANGTPEKVFANNSSVVRTGSWSTSNVYSAMGLMSQSAGSTLTFNLPGSTLFAALSSVSADAVYSISVDGQTVGTYQPTVLIGSPEVYGVRIPIAGSTLTKSHSLTVTCVTPGANGCHVDFVSSNAATAPMQPPYLWTMSPEATPQGNPAAWYNLEAADVSALTAAFASDGFTIAYGDLNYRYSNVSSPECFASDNIHSLDCGHQLIAATLIAAMDNVNSALQRIAFPTLPVAPATGIVNLAATATSGLPVTYTVDSGPGTIVGSTLVSTGSGAVVVTAHQSGNAVFLPAPNVSQTVSFGGADPSLLLSIPNHTFGDPAFTIAATSNSPAAITYSVTSGPATISGSRVAVSGAGTVTITASQAAVSPYTAAVTIVSFAVAPATPSITWLPAVGSILGGSALGASELNAGSATPGTFSYTATLSGGSPVAVTAATVLSPGTYTLTANFTPTDNVDYLTATSTAVLVVQPQYIWVANGNGSVSVVNETGQASASATPAGGLAIAIDNQRNVWSINATGTSLIRLNSASANVVNTFTGGGISAATALAIDGAGQVWVANGANSVSAFTNAGLPISSSTGFTEGKISKPTGVAVDTSGNVWIANSGNNSVTEILGGAAPVVPLANAVANNNLAVKP